MKKSLVVAALAGLVSLPIQAADPIAPMPVVLPPSVLSPVAAHDWSGFYLGASGAFGRVSSTSGVPDQTAFGAGIHAGFNVDMGASVVGVEGEFAPSALANLSVGALRLGHSGRITGHWGLKLGETGSTLVYGRAGLGIAQSTNAGVDYTDLGWTVGAGVTQALSDDFSVTGEISYVRFDNAAGTGFTVDGVGARIGLSYHF